MKRLFSNTAQKDSFLTMKAKNITPRVPEDTFSAVATRLSSFAEPSGNTLFLSYQSSLLEIFNHSLYSYSCNVFILL